MRFLYAVLGRLLAAAPEVVARVFCAVLGDTVWVLMRGRRRVMMAALHHAFPGKPEAWRREVGHRTCRRAVELGLFAVASPYFSVAHVRSILVADASLRDDEDGVLAPGPLVIFSPHFTLMEGLSMTGGVLPKLMKRELGVFYRPARQPEARRGR